MKFLVTGNKGFIGQHMMEELRHHSVDTLEWGEQYPVIKNGNYDWIIHLGANSSTIEKDVDLVMEQNYEFSVKLYEDAKRHDINFQYSSSAAVYGLNSQFNEDAPKDPRSPYAWSKYLFDRYVLNNLPKKSIVQGFRYFNVYGPEYEDHKGDQASPYYKFMRQARETGEIKVFKNSDKFARDFIHVSEVISTHMKFLDVKESGIWNVGTGKIKSFQDVAEEIAKKYKAEIKQISMPEHLKGQYQTFTQADITKLKATLAKLD